MRLYFDTRQSLTRQTTYAESCGEPMTCVRGIHHMMHVTGDGKRMYVTNSLLSTLDHSGRFYLRLIHIGPDGMKVGPVFNIDLNHLRTGPARGHDMLIN